MNRKMCLLSTKEEVLIEETERDIEINGCNKVNVRFEHYLSESFILCHTYGCNKFIEGLPPLDKILRIIHVYIINTLLKSEGITHKSIIEQMNGDFRDKQMKSILKPLCRDCFNKLDKDNKLGYQTPAPPGTPYIPSLKNQTMLT